MGINSFRLSELLEEANRIRSTNPDLADTAEFNERTVYYYVQQDLLPSRAGTRGPGSRYSEDFLYRLLFIRRLQKEEALTLADIKLALEEVDDDTIRRIALGKEPVVFKTYPTPDDVKQIVEKGEGFLELRGAKRLNELSAVNKGLLPEDDVKVLQNARAHGDGKIPSERIRRAKSYKSSTRPARHTFPLGPDASLVINKPVTARQTKHLNSIVELIKSILEDEE